MSEQPTVESADYLIDDPDAGDDELSRPFRSLISSYGADISVEELISGLEKEEIFIPPFQRRFTWSLAQSSRFIESLLLGLPVPSLFFFEEPDTDHLMVVDGQQRLLTLHAFVAGRFSGKKFNLVGVSDDVNGQSYRDLAPEHQGYINDYLIHASIFKLIEPSNDLSAVYSVFERLNTGGTQLMPQELRAAIYRGRFSDLLSEMADNTHWRNLFGPRNIRKKDEEVILRFLALNFCRHEYERPMKLFLNRFMEENRDISDGRAREFRTTFERTVEAAAAMLKSKAFRPDRALNVSVADAVLVGLSHRLKKGAISSGAELRAAHQQLLDVLRGESLYTERTTVKERVNQRIAYACNAFEAVQ